VILNLAAALSLHNTRVCGGRIRRPQYESNSGLVFAAGGES